MPDSHRYKYNGMFINISRMVRNIGANIKLRRRPLNLILFFILCLHGLFLQILLQHGHIYPHHFT